MSQTSTTNKKKRLRPRRRVVLLEAPPLRSNLSGSPLPRLPDQQYRVVLTRRAIRRPGNNDSDEEDAGDTSLGLKLIVVAAKVVVQQVTPLADGRASPAMMTTPPIQRGDVLLAVNHQSLVDLPMEQLLQGLQPLSSPEDANEQVFARTVQLRFLAGGGLALLKVHQEQQEQMQLLESSGGADPDGGMAAARDMFSLFPMMGSADVSLPTNTEPAAQDDDNDTVSASEDGAIGAIVRKDSDDASLLLVPTDEAISLALAVQRHLERSQFVRSQIRDIQDQVVAEEESDLSVLSKKQRLALGHLVLHVASQLSHHLQSVEEGRRNQVRSFRHWKTTLSLQSRASARRRLVLDSASVPAYARKALPHVWGEEEDGDDDDTDQNVGGSDSEASSVGDSDQEDAESPVDGDELLLQLAAQDEIWRKQVLDALQAAVNSLDDPDKEHESAGEEDKDNPASVLQEDNHSNKENAMQHADTLLSNELGAFLFGANIAKVMKRKKSISLPPPDVTSVLFDLCTNLATMANYSSHPSKPEEITLGGQTSVSFFSMPSSLASPSARNKRGNEGNDEAILAHQFVLERALPIWLETFRPLPWEHRRVLWPRVKHAAGGGGASTTAGSTILSDDSLTIDSAGSGGAAAKGPSRNLQELIEDQELDPESRAETCFLLTFYFTFKLLPAHVAHDPSSSAGINVFTFIHKYGAYLQLHTCLCKAMETRARDVLESLLEVASHDPNHRDSMKELQRARVLVFYHSTKLSALVLLLSSVAKEPKADRQEMILNLCAAAYPDILPWAVRESCFGPEPENIQLSHHPMVASYYRYLSILLHPTEGHPKARKDLPLIKEFCLLSISELNGVDDKSRRENFFNLASRSSSSHLAYRRDLLTLLEMSPEMRDPDLVIDLASEVVESPKLNLDENALEKALESTRQVAQHAISSAEPGAKNAVFRVMRRLLRFFGKMSGSSSETCRNAMDTSRELCALLEIWSEKFSEDNFELLDYFVAHATPSEILKCLVLWTRDHSEIDVVPRLRECLKRGAQDALENELSGSLLRLNHSRLTSHNLPARPAPLARRTSSSSNRPESLWERMYKGTLSLEK